MFKIFYLPNCPYSKKSLQILNKYNLVDSSNQINCDDKTNFISDPDNLYIPSDYSTYPKILFSANTITPL